MGMAAGWNWEPAFGRHGPQVTGFVGPLYIRANHYLDHETTVSFGLVVKGELSWAWSR